METPPAAVPIAGPAAGLSAADASALINQTASLQTELAAARAQLARSAETDSTNRKTAAIAAALANAPLIPGTAGQITTLLEKDIALHTDPATGQVVAVGPNLTPVGTYLQAQLGRPEFQHFLAARNPGGGTAGGTGVQSAPTAPPWSVAEPPPTSLGEAILQGARNAAKNAVPGQSTGGSYTADDGTVVRRPAAGFGLKPLGR
jgi:hypothetical protein